LHLEPSSAGSAHRRVGPGRPRFQGDRRRQPGLGRGRIDGQRARQIVRHRRGPAGTSRPRWSDYWSWPEPGIVGISRRNSGRPATATARSRSGSLRPISARSGRGGDDLPLLPKKECWQSPARAWCYTPRWEPRSPD
jgi:hypothetical protein